MEKVKTKGQSVQKIEWKQRKLAIVLPSVLTRSVIINVLSRNANWNIHTLLKVFMYSAENISEKIGIQYKKAVLSQR